MARRKPAHRVSAEAKLEAVQAVLGGETIAEVAERYKVSTGALVYWRRQHETGAFGNLAKSSKGAKAKPNEADEIEARGMTPEALFTSRVNRAIVSLRQAQREVVRMQNEGKIKGPDKAHLLAQLALLELQGDNGG